MRKLLRFFDTVDDYLERVLYVVGMVAFTLFVLLIVYQVISRNVSVIPVIQWTEEVSRFSFMWMIMLGATIGVLRSDHFLIDIFENHRQARRFTRWLREVLILLVGLVFVFEGYGFGLSGARRIAMASGLPMSYIYMSFFVMGLLTCFFSVHRLLLLFIGRVEGLDEFDRAKPLVVGSAETELDSTGLTDDTSESPRSEEG